MANIVGSIFLIAFAWAYSPDGKRMEATLGDLIIETELSGLSLGLIRLRNAEIMPAVPELLSEIESASGAPSVDRKASVRDMLRFGKYKPTGRGKPAWEYLLRAVEEGRFPQINNLVDALNLVSFRTQLPISILDTDLAASERFCIRRGRDESFVFNSAGQTIGLRDLLLVSSLPDDLPCANPVKDSMRTKLTEQSKNALCVIYGPADLCAGVREATQTLRNLYLRFGGAEVLVDAGGLDAV